MSKGEVVDGNIELKRMDSGKDAGKRRHSLDIPLYAQQAEGPPPSFFWYFVGEHSLTSCVWVAENDIYKRKWRVLSFVTVLLFALLMAFSLEIADKDTESSQEVRKAKIDACYSACTESWTTKTIAEAEAYASELGPQPIHHGHTPCEVLDNTYRVGEFNKFYLFPDPKAWNIDSFNNTWADTCHASLTWAHEVGGSAPTLYYPRGYAICFEVGKEFDQSFLNDVIAEYGDAEVYSKDTTSDYLDRVCYLDDEDGTVADCDARDTRPHTHVHDSQYLLCLSSDTELVETSKVVAATLDFMIEVLIIIPFSWFVGKYTLYFLRLKKKQDSKLQRCVGGFCVNFMTGLLLTIELIILMTQAKVMWSSDHFTSSSINWIKSFFTALALEAAQLTFSFIYMRVRNTGTIHRGISFAINLAVMITGIVLSVG